MRASTIGGQASVLRSSSQLLPTISLLHFFPNSCFLFVFCACLAPLPRSFSPTTLHSTHKPCPRTTESAVRGQYLCSRGHPGSRGRRGLSFAGTACRFIHELLLLAGLSWWGRPSSCQRSESFLSYSLRFMIDGIRDEWCANVIARFELGDMKMVNYPIALLPLSFTSTQRSRSAPHAVVFKTVTPSSV